MRHLIFGLGSIGKRHARHLLRCGHEVYGVDPYVEDASDFPVHRVAESGWQWNPHMVWICSPTHLHAEQAVEALKRGVHVFIEKPVAHQIMAAHGVRDAWEAMPKKSLVWVGCNMRFHPAVKRLKQVIEEERIGRPLIYRIHFSHYLPNMRPGIDYRRTYAARADMGGGIILDDIHDIDLALWLGGPVKRFVGFAGHSGFLEMDAEDVAHISLCHENGAFSDVHMDFLRRDKSRGIQVIGEKGTLEWRSFGKNPEKAELQWFQSGEEEAELLWEDTITSFDGMFVDQLEAVLEAASEPVKSPNILKEATEALRIALEVRGSHDCPC